MFLLDYTSHSLKHAVKLYTLSPARFSSALQHVRWCNLCSMQCMFHHMGLTWQWSTNSDSQKERRQAALNKSFFPPTWWLDLAECQINGFLVWGPLTLGSLQVDYIVTLDLVLDRDPCVLGLCEGVREPHSFLHGVERLALRFLVLPQSTQCGFLIMWTPERNLPHTGTIPCCQGSQQFCRLTCEFKHSSTLTHTPRKPSMTDPKHNNNNLFHIS